MRKQGHFSLNSTKRLPIQLRGVKSLHFILITEKRILGRSAHFEVIFNCLERLHDFMTSWGKFTYIVALNANLSVQQS